MSILRTGSGDSTATSPGAPAARRLGRVPVPDLLAVAGLVVVAGLIEFFLRSLLTRHFYYDEAWRAYEIAQGSDFLTRLPAAVAPVAFGWLGIENAARVLLGNTEAGLRAPMFLALPLLAAATYWLARRWLGIGVSFCVAGLLLANTWIINYALQLKPYSFEGLLTVAAVALYVLLHRTSTGHPAKLIGLYALLGLTCVFSLPNLFVVGPLLALDLVEALRARDRVALRIGGETLAAAIALAHYVMFVRLQSGIASVFFHTRYAPDKLGAFVRFAIKGTESYVPSMVTGVAGGARSLATPSYALPPAAHHLLAVALVLMLAAGVVAAVRDVAGRALVVAAGGALLLELLASAMQRWPFGLLRMNIFVLPLLYILGGIGVRWLAVMLRGPVRADGSRPMAATWSRVIGLGVAAAALVAAGAAAGVATAHALAETSELQAKPTWFGGTAAAVADARLEAKPDDLVIIRADRSPPAWYVGPWLYYMKWYEGYPEPVASSPRVPASNTFAVAFVKPDAVDQFLAAHAGSPAIFLLEYDASGGRFPQSTHRESLSALLRFGYCPERDIALPDTGELTVLGRSGCSRS